MKNLVIVESPTKARTIGRFLGTDFEVIASMGHIYDLPKSTLGVDIENDFNPQYELVSDKKKTLSQLKSAAKKAQRVILATDLDREGEAIAYHIAQNIGIKDADRIVFHEITKEAIDEALTNPNKINKNLVDAQTARRVLDRLVGYKLSPLLWSKVRRGLSAGRVQSVALRLIVEREREIAKFQKEPYFTITVNLKNNSNGTPFELIEIDGKRIEISQKLNLYDGEYKFVKTLIIE
jgi:DNA topoisomerase-1